MTRTRTAKGTTLSRHRMLGIYLNDHFADATAGTELAHRMARSHQNRKLEETSDLQRLAVEISQDRATLLDIMAASASHARLHDEPAAQDERAITIRVIAAPLSASCRSAAVAHSASSGCLPPLSSYPPAARRAAAYTPSVQQAARGTGASRKAGRDRGGARSAAGAAGGRDDRNPAELIQELPVVSLGVQVLSGLLPPLPFTVRVRPAADGQRNLCLASLVPSAAATVLLLGPVAYHRLVFRQGVKRPLVKSANVMAILGMAAVGAAMLTAVPLATGVVAGVLAVALITAVMACARQPVVRPAADPAR